MLKIIDKDLERELKKIKKKAILGTPAQEKTVAAIIAEVKRGGDATLIRLTQKFDKIDIKGKIKIPSSQFEIASKLVSRDYIQALRRAIKNIQNYHSRQKADEWFTTKPFDVVLGQRIIPLDSVGVYVPGGRAIYPTTVLMNVIPAQIAGVGRIILLSPPPIDPHILAAAAELNVKEVYQVGGAQGIAALAFGTQTIPKVDKIVGPGNLYVTLAKKLLIGSVGIDKLAGPSEALIIADQDADPRFVAADLLAQAEHDPDSVAMLITDSKPLAYLVKGQINKQLKNLARQSIIIRALESRGAIFVVSNLERAAEIANEIAPEHLELMVDTPQKFLEKIKNAGAVFLGPYSPAAVGDYIAGPNHVLPTGGTARFSSPLGGYDFVKKQSFIAYTEAGLQDVKDDLLKLAEVEGFTAHGRSVEIRLE